MGKSKLKKAPSMENSNKRKKEKNERENFSSFLLFIEN